MPSVEKAPASANQTMRLSPRGSFYDAHEHDPPALIAVLSSCPGAFVHVQGQSYFREPSEGLALLTAEQLRIIADELDNRNGVDEEDDE